MKITINILTLFLFILLSSNKSQAQLVITEVQSSNSALNLDFDEYDWVEIYNSGTTAIDLTGYYMSDDPDNILGSELLTYTGPFTSNMNTVVEAGDYILVICSNIAQDEIGSLYDYLHASFKLSSEGEEVHLSDPNGNLVSSLVFPSLVQNESYGYNTNGDLGYFSIATPRAENGTANFSLTAPTLTPPVVDLPSQIFTTNQQVTILTDEPGAVYYTLDGSNPTAASTEYTGAFTVSTTTVVKSILIQSDTGEISRLGMRTLLFDKSHELAVLSITSENFTRFGSGDYLKPVFNGRVWVELIEPDNSTSNAQYADFTASGRTSAHVPAMNGKLRTKEKYGDEVFSNKNGAIFPNKQHIEDVFSFVIKNASQDWNGANMRDVFGTTLIIEDSLIAYGFEDNRRVVVYVNGEYQGVLSISEDDDDDFTENNYQDEEIITQYVLDDLTSFIEHSVDYTNETERNALLDIIDMRDYHFFNFHLTYGDMNNETGMFAYVTEGEKADWIIHDEDSSFNIDSNPVEFTIGTPLEWPFTTLKAEDYEPFKEDLIQSYCTYASFMYDEARVLEILNAKEAEIESEMEATIQYHKDFITEREAANLGITFFRDGIPLNDLNEWKSEVQIIRDFVTGRLDNMFTDFQTRYGLEAPENFEISSSDYNMGYVRVQGVKLREETMTGQFFKDLPIELIAEPNTGYQFSHWEGLSTSTDTQIAATINTSSQITAVFKAISIDDVSLHINEVQPKNDTTYADELGEYNDWVEIYNSGTTDVDLAGFYLSDNPDITNKYQVVSGEPTKTIVPAGGFLILWLDNDTEQGANHLGFKLDTEDEIVLVNIDGLTIIDSMSFNVNADESYGVSSNGDNSSLEVFTTPTPNATNNQALPPLAEVLEDSQSTGGSNNANGTAVTASQLAAITGIINVDPANEAAYQTAINSETGFSNLPSLIEVQAIIDAVNANTAINDVLAEVLEDSQSTDGSNNANGTAVTASQLAAITGIINVDPANEAAYQTAINSETGFSNLPTVTEIQAIIDTVNANTAINDVLAEVLEDSQSTDGSNNANGTAVTASQLAAITGIINVDPANEAAYQTTINSETGFSNLPTVTEIQAIVDEVNTVVIVDNSSEANTLTQQELTNAGVINTDLSSEEITAIELAISTESPSPITTEELQYIVDNTVNDLGADDFDNIIIYPNPSSEQFIISGIDVEKYTMYTILGAQVLENRITNVVDISRMDKGIYLLNIITIKGKLFNKVVVVE